MEKKWGNLKMMWGIMALILGMAIVVYYENNGITVTEIAYSNAKIPEAFEGYRILQISDLHNKAFGKNQKRLLQAIEANNPDIIVITGDIIDRRKYDLDTAMEFIEGAVKITDVYFVSGNHEVWSGRYYEIIKALQDHGVTVLEDQKTQIVNGSDKITIVGVADYYFHYHGYGNEDPMIKFKNILNNLSDASGFQILLSHRPEFFELYSEVKVDLIFSGHAHGGQFRLPFIGGLAAPGQGLLPEYTSGAHTKDNSTLVVSRGLGNSIIPLRIGNPPEVVVVTLSAE